MIDDPRPTPSQSRHRRDAGALASTLIVGALVVWGWFVIGPGHPAYAFVVAGATFFLGASVGILQPDACPSPGSTCPPPSEHGTVLWASVLSPESSIS